MSDSTAEVTTTENAERTRFEVFVDGTLAGFADYSDAAPEGIGVRTFPHTEVLAEFEGNGYSTPLIRTALDATREAGLMVRPLCSAVAHFVEKNPEYRELVSG